MGDKFQLILQSSLVVGEGSSEQVLERSQVESALTSSPTHPQLSPKSKLSLIDDGDEEEEDDDMRRSVKPDREQNRRNMSGSSRKVNVAAGDLEEGGGGTAPE